MAGLVFSRLFFLRFVFSRRHSWEGGGCIAFIASLVLDPHCWLPDPSSISLLQTPLLL